MSHANAKINGQMGCETRGGTVSYYVPDTQGSLIECHDSSGNTVHKAWYWPYGEVRTSSGSKVNPWGYIGLKGYLTDLANLLYVRARYYRPQLTRWQTVDPLWPEEQPFLYAQASPPNKIDPLGLQPFLAGCLGGVLVSGVISFCFSHDSLLTTVCKAVGACLLGGLLGWLMTVIPWEAGCLVGALGAIVNDLVDKVCEGKWPPRCRSSSAPSNACLFLAIVFSALLGCFGTGEYTDGTIQFILGAAAAIGGVHCPDYLYSITP